MIPVPEAWIVRAQIAFELKANRAESFIADTERSDFERWIEIDRARRRSEHEAKVSIRYVPFDDRAEATRQPFSYRDSHITSAEQASVANLRKTPQQPADVVLPALLQDIQADCGRNGSSASRYKKPPASGPQSDCRAKLDRQLAVQHSDGCTGL